jgi:hypothetical protein
MLDPDVVAKLRLQLVVSPKFNAGVNRGRRVTKSMTMLILVCMDSFGMFCL